MTRPLPWPLLGGPLGRRSSAIKKCIDRLRNGNQYQLHPYTLKLPKCSHFLPLPQSGMPSLYISNVTLRSNLSSTSLTKVLTVCFCGQYKTRTADYGLGLRTGYKTRTEHYGLGIKYGLGIIHGPSITDSVWNMKKRSTSNKFSHKCFHKWKLLISRKSPLIQV